MTGPGPQMLRIPSARLRWETERALEIQAADEALSRSRFRWFLLGMASVAVGYLPMALAWHTSSKKTGDVLFWTAILLSDVGPMVVLWCWARSEEG